MEVENQQNSAESQDEHILDFSCMELDGEMLSENLDGSFGESDPVENPVQVLVLNHNRLATLPRSIAQFQNLRHLDLNNNLFAELPEAILQLQNLKTLTARANRLTEHSIPKEFGLLKNLENLNFSGNAFKDLPPQILELSKLKTLYLGGNLLETLPTDIWKLEKLETLYLGGNQLQEIPTEIGQLHHLRALILSENRLRSLPPTVSCLKRLRSLALHKNCLTTLPPKIISLKGLVELSLRENPLVVRFVRDMTYDPPSLREMAARSIKTYKVPYHSTDLPASLIAYLTNAQRCVNPKCKGVYFDARVEHIKFVDFCGKYRLPLQQYLCSPSCSGQSIVYTSSSSDTDESDALEDVPASKLKRVLLG